MKASQRAVVVLAFAVIAFGVTATWAAASHAARSQRPTRGRGEKVAVQPIDGPKATQSLRNLVVRIVRGRGFRTITSLPRFEGTGQYPGLARDHHLAAFVTADVEERGRWQRVTFLVWDGQSGSVLGRWTASAPATKLARAVGKGFWPRLGPAVLKAEAPPLPTPMEQAAPMHIDASEAMDEPVATR